MNKLVSVLTQKQSANWAEHNRCDMMIAGLVSFWGPYGSTAHRQAGLCNYLLYIGRL